MNITKRRSGSVKGSTTSRKKRMEALLTHGRMGVNAALLLADFGDATLLSRMIALSDIAVGRVVNIARAVRAMENKN